MDSNTYITFHGIEDESFELSQTVIDPGTSSLLHHGFVNLQDNEIS